MIYGKLHADGSLTDIHHRSPKSWPDNATDVELVAMPSTVGPYAYDAVNKLAVSVAPPMSFQEAVARRLSTGWPSNYTPTQRNAIQATIDAAVPQTGTG